MCENCECKTVNTEMSSSLICTQLLLKWISTSLHSTQSLHCQLSMMNNVSLRPTVYGPIPWRPQTMMATMYTRRATAMKMWKTNGVLLRNRQIHDIVGQISPSYVFGCHGLWPSLSNPQYISESPAQSLMDQPIVLHNTSEWVLTTVSNTSTHTALLCAH